MQSSSQRRPDPWSQDSLAIAIACFTLGFTTNTVLTSMTNGRLQGLVKRLRGIFSVPEDQAETSDSWQPTWRTTVRLLAAVLVLDLVLSLVLGLTFLLVK